ncbi:MAG: SGNH/GDSL hydrolase family protein [Ruminococcus sp.]|nr:SGNH/GDSL hydrolase family protein [Ruminococcus sp.]
MAEFAVKGNNSRFKAFFDKAKRGEALNVAFLGGSITMGCHATTEENRYVNRIFSHIQSKFPKSKMTLINGGIGATTSQFGAARINDDILKYDPDLVFIEFSVNDDNNIKAFQETYESCIRRILKFKTAPACLVINNLFYDTGFNAQEIHNEAAAFYGVPAVSVRDYDWPRLQSGELKRDDLTADGLHPNDKGMEIIAMLVNNAIDEMIDEPADKPIAIPEKPLTKARYETAARFDNRNLTPTLSGFCEDKEPQRDITDVFKNGYIAEKSGAYFKMETNARIICIQWRRTINRPAPIAKVVIDGDESKAVILDANFEEDWGDLLALTTVFESDVTANHTVELTVTEQPDNNVPFYLVSVITA